MPTSLPRRRGCLHEYEPLYSRLAFLQWMDLLARQSLLDRDTLFA
jgi:hypothetical protein